jgi:hypothetical protein
MEYHHILYFIGYGWKYKTIKYNNNGIDDIHIDIELNNNMLEITQKNKASIKNFKYCQFFNICYNLILIILIGWPIIFSLINKMDKKNSNIFFQVLFLIQYITGIIYFNSDHFYEKLKEIKDKHIFYKNALIGATVFSIILTGISIALFKSGYNMGVYSYIDQYEILIFILLICEKVVSYLSFFVNMISFCIIMIYHKNKIIIFNDKLNNIRTINFSLIINNVTTDFMELKKEYEETIDKLNNIFASISGLGIIALYFKIKLFLTGIIGEPFDIINIILFIIVEIIYIKAIYTVRTNVDNIRTKMISHEYIIQLLNDNNEIKINISQLDNSDIINEIVYKTLIISAKSSNTIKWIIMKDILSAQWNTFNFLGFPITDISLIYRIIGTGITFFVTVDLASMLT